MVDFRRQIYRRQILMSKVDPRTIRVNRMALAWRHALDGHCRQRWHAAHWRTDHLKGQQYNAGRSSTDGPSSVLNAGAGNYLEMTSPKMSLHAPIFTCWLSLPHHSGRYMHCSVFITGCYTRWAGRTTSILCFLALETYRGAWPILYDMYIKIMFYILTRVQVDIKLYPNVHNFIYICIFVQLYCIYLCI